MWSVCGSAGKADLVVDTPGSSWPEIAEAALGQQAVEYSTFFVIAVPLVHRSG